MTKWIEGAKSLANHFGVPLIDVHPVVLHYVVEYGMADETRGCITIDSLPGANVEAGMSEFGIEPARMIDALHWAIYNASNWYLAPLSKGPNYRLSFMNEHDYILAKLQL
jgi:hypothetical protein